MGSTKGRLVLVLSCKAGSNRAKLATGLVKAGVKRGTQIKIYLVDEGVTLAQSDEKSPLKTKGVTLFGCAHGARQRGVPLVDEVTWGGLGLLSDLIAADARVVSL